MNEIERIEQRKESYENSGFANPANMFFRVTAPDGSMEEINVVFLDMEVQYMCLLQTYRMVK